MCSTGRRAIEGQIQRDEYFPTPRKTFYDVCVQSGGPTAERRPIRYGDIKLVPMLEIEAPATTANLPPAAIWQVFGILTKTATGTTSAMCRFSS